MTPPVRPQPKAVLSRFKTPAPAAVDTAYLEHAKTPEALAYRAAQSASEGDADQQTSYLLHTQGKPLDSELYKQKAIDAYLQANAQRDSAKVAPSPKK